MYPSQADQLKDSEAFYKWAQNRSGLATPKKTLAQKKGKGIYRRFFYWVPSKGTGAVNRARLPTLKAEGTSKLHEFVDIGVVGRVSTRRASCHQCDKCWLDERTAARECPNKAFVGMPIELAIVREGVPAAAAARMDRAALNRAALERADRAEKASVVCIETHKDEQTFPWVIGAVVEPVHNAAVASPPYDPTKDAIHLEPVKANEPALSVTLYEALEPGSSTYVVSEMTIFVPARRVRVIDVELEELRSGPVRTAAQAHIHASGPRLRYKIVDDSLYAIRAEMPTSSDNWEVETVVEYRMVYGVEQWLVKWKTYGEDRNTWEPWENLLTEEVQSEAQRVKDASLPTSMAGLKKLTVPRLIDALQARSLPTEGNEGRRALKDVLVARLFEALMNEGRGGEESGAP